MTVQLHVLGSGSKGNAFAVVDGTDGLLVEAGFGPKALLRRAERGGLDPACLRGVVVSHEHGDHARGATATAGRLGIPVLCSPGTWRALGAPAGTAHVPLRPNRPLAFGRFRLESCLTAHDAAEPLALAVQAGSGVRIAFAMDLGRTSGAIRYLLREAHGLVVEANYDELLLRTGRYPPSVQQRIAGSGGHLSNRAAATLVAEVWHRDLDAVVLAHLSQECNAPERARAEVDAVLRTRRFAGSVAVAAQDRPLPPISVRAGPGRDQGELALQWDEGWPARPGSGSPGRPAPAPRA
jgi:phosphoribosyl 1,2-cyclic phosphodiesterase